MIEIALKEYGVSEIPGRSHNNRILHYAHAIGERWVKSDETSWCSIYMSFIALKAGKPYPLKAPATARSWLKVGTHVTEPRLGDIVVFWRVSKDSWQGHVGIFIRESENNIWVLGGNQDNQVCIKPYPKDRLLGYRKI